MVSSGLPNLITLFRICIIPVFIVCFYLPFSYAHMLAALIFILASFSDWLDGYLARKLIQTSKLGAFLDPVADKLLVGCVIVMLVKKGRAGEIPCLLILAREFLIAGLREFLAIIRVSVPVSRLAKIKTLFPRNM